MSKNKKHKGEKMDRHCIGHKQPITVTKAPVRIMAGGKMSNTPIPLGSTVLALGISLESPITGLPTLESKVVRVDWPDMSVPSIDVEGWRRIAKALAALRKPLYVSCSAGHGRTGTALAILCHMLGQMPKKVDPVAWVREVYCPCAIETQAQIDYVAAITGRETPSKGSQSTWESAGSTNGSYTGYQGYQSKAYEDGMVWDTKTRSWKQPATPMGQTYDFSKKPTKYCKGRNDKCAGRVEPPIVFCLTCQDKEQVNADGTPKGSVPRVDDAQVLPGTGSALDDVTSLQPRVEPRGTFPPMDPRGKPDYKKYFPGND